MMILVRESVAEVNVHQPVQEGEKVQYLFDIAI